MKKQRVWAIKNMATNKIEPRWAARQLPIYDRKRDAEHWCIQDY